jgi:antitoxin component YwqK of YwqJK toxin-antitoxin module
MKYIFLFTIILCSINTTYSQKELTNESITIEIEALYSNLQLLIGEAETNLYKCNKQHIVKKQIVSAKKILEEKYTSIESLKEENESAYYGYTRLLGTARESILDFEEKTNLANDLCKMIGNSEAIKSEDDVKNICELYNGYKIVAGTYDHYETQIKTNYNGTLETNPNESCCDCFESKYWFMNKADEAYAHIQEVVTSLNEKFNNLPKNQQEIAVSGNTDALFDRYRGFITSNPNDTYGKPLSTDGIRKEVANIKNILNCKNKFVIKKTYFENGNLETVGANLNGLKTRKWKEYYENGSIRSIGKYKNGQQSGEWKFYYENGQLYAKGIYENGKRIGEWKFYDENGQLRAIGKYENGNYTGEWKNYHENGSIASIGKYKNGQQSGEWELYGKNGKLIKTEKF